MATDYPIVEIFYSLQGEGAFTGEPTVFIRLGGCNVGKRDQKMQERFPVLNDRYAKGGVCTMYNGHQFLCDTLYNDFGRLKLDEIISKVEKETIPYLEGQKLPNLCFTGGEPFVYNLEPIVESLRPKMREDAYVTFETSGTREIPRGLLDVGGLVNIACSPKQGFNRLNAAFIDEYRFLIDARQSPQDWDADILRFIKENVTPFLKGKEIEIWLSPVADDSGAFADSAKNAIHLCKMYPETYRLSLQTHKCLSIR